MSFLFPFSLKLHCCSHIQFMVFSSSYCRTTFLLPQIIFFSFVRRLSRIHFHIKGTILHNSLVLFYLFVFLFLNTLFSFWKVSFSILMHLRISVLYFAFSVQALPRYLNLLYLLDFDISNL